MYAVRKEIKKVQKKKKKDRYGEAVPERMEFDELSDWMPSWVLPKYLTESELRQPVRGRSI